MHEPSAADSPVPPPDRSNAQRFTPSHRSYGAWDAKVRAAGLTGLAAVILLLAGCGSAPRAPGGGVSATTGTTVQPADRDGPEANPPPGLASVPDAQPRLESIRIGGPNKPYTVFGRNYVPFVDDRRHVERGLASWYGRKFHGRQTANGEIYDMYAMTAAHPTMPLPSYVRVRNAANQREVIVRVNDRGPFHPGRIIDLSYTAALKLDLLRGVAPVEIERITDDDIRTGAWRRNGPGSTMLAEASAPPVGAAVVAAVPPPAAPAARAVEVPVAAAVPVSAAPAEQAGLAAGVGNGADRADTAAVGFFIQIGAFSQRDGAESFRRRVSSQVDWISPLLAVYSEPGVHRLQVGPYASRDEAMMAAQRVRDDLRLVPLVVERR